MKKTLSLLLCFLLLLSAAGCGQEEELPSKSNFLLDTLVTITLYDDSDPAVLELAFDEIARLEKEMKAASKMLEFEYAALLRDQIIELRKET